MPDVLYAPTDELVAWGWLKSCPLLDGIGSGTSLPQKSDGSGADVTRWGSNAYAQVNISPLSPTPSPYFPSHTPRIVVSCWARPKQWSDAANLAQLIRQETYRRTAKRVVSMPVNGYATARVMAIQTLAEPGRITGDPDQLARFDIPLSIEWIESNWVPLD